MLSPALLLAALALGFAPPERDDLLDLADEADLADQARIEEALFDPEIKRSGLRLLEQEIRDRRDRRLADSRARAIAVGLDLQIISEDAAQFRRSSFAFIASVGVGFDLLVGEPRRGPVPPPIREMVRAERCDRLALEERDLLSDRADVVLRAVARRELERALGCAWEAR